MKKNLDEISSLYVAILGGFAYLVAGYLALGIYRFIPRIISITNGYHGILPTPAIGLWLIMGIYSIIIWVCYGVAHRCHTILYKRWFESL